MDNTLNLRRAAEKIDKLASQARSGNWTTAPSETIPTTTLVVADWNYEYKVVAQARGSLAEGNLANAEFIAAMNPRVAKKLALSMKAAADILSESDADAKAWTLVLEAMFSPLIDVALEILGEAREEMAG